MLNVLVSENGIHDVSLSTGSDPSKPRWKAVGIVLHEVTQVSPTWRARAGLAVNELGLSRKRFWTN